MDEPRYGTWGAFGRKNARLDQVARAWIFERPAPFNIREGYMPDRLVELLGPVVALEFYGNRSELQEKADAMYILGSLAPPEEGPTREEAEWVVDQRRNLPTVLERLEEAEEIIEEHGWTYNADEGRVRELRDGRGQRRLFLQECVGNLVEALADGKEGRPEKWGYGNELLGTVSRWLRFYFPPETVTPKRVKGLYDSYRR